MVWSNDMQFEVVLINPKCTDSKKNMYKEITTPDGLYVIAAPDDEFQIQLHSEDKNNTYSAIVIIDGYQMPQSKNFRRTGKVLGFKHDQGTYRAFKFSRPQPGDCFGQNKFVKPTFSEKKYLEINNSHENDRIEWEGGPGQIIVRIYRTEEQQRKPPRDGGGGGGGPREPREPKEHNDPVFQPFTFNDDKSSADQALGVTFGEVYQTKTGGGGGGGSMQGSTRGDGPSYKGILSEEGIVASFKFFYTDIYSLLQKRYINLDYPQHLTLLPSYFFKQNEKPLLQVMQTVVRGGRAGNANGASLEEIINRLGFWIKCPIYDMLSKELKEENQVEQESSFKPSDEEMVRNFLKQHHSYFQEDDTAKDLFRCGTQISKKLMQGEEGEI